MKKILITLFTVIAFFGFANSDSLIDTDKAAQKALAEKYVQALQEKDLNAVNQLIDYDVYADNVLTKLSVKDKNQEKNQLNKLKAQAIQYQKKSQKSYTQKDYITVIGWLEQPKFSGYMVRFINSEYMTSYLGIMPKKINNQWKIVDFYDVSKQDTISNFVATTLNQTVFNKDSVIARLIGSYNAIDMSNYVLFAKKIKQNQYPQAIKIYHSFSDDMKREETVVDMGLSITKYFSDDRAFYNELIETIGTYHKDNPKYHARLISYYFIKKEYGKARERIKNFCSLISDKAMMNFTLGQVSFTEEDSPRALKEIKQCAKAEPNLKPCYDLWIGIADTIKNYDEEVLAYQTMSENLNIDLNKSIFNEQEDGDFMRSDAFRNWDIPEKSE